MLWRSTSSRIPRPRIRSAIRWLRDLDCLSMGSSRSTENPRRQFSRIAWPEALARTVRIPAFLTMRLAILRSIAIVIAFVSVPNSAHSCECVRIGDETRDTLLNGASVAFVGWPVASRCVVKNGNVVALEYDFEVSRTWLASHRRTRIRTPLSTCGLLFELGVSYLIIAHDNDHSVTRCSATGSEPEARGAITLLGPPLHVFRRWHAPRVHHDGDITPKCLRELAQ